MPTQLSPAKRKALGLENCSFGEPEVIPIGGGEASHGLSGDSTRSFFFTPGRQAGLGLAALLAAGINPAAFAEVPSRHAEEVGVSLGLHDDNSNLLLVSSKQNSRFVIVDSTKSRDGSGRYGEDPDRTVVDLAGGPIRLETADGHNLVVMRSKDSIEVIPVQPLDDDAPEIPLAALRSTLEDWANLSSDSWLTGQVRDRTAERDAWSAMAAAGMAARLHEPASPEEARSIIKAALAGEVTSTVAAPHQWMATLTREQLDAMTLQVVRRAEQMTQRVRWLGEEIDSESEAWRERVLDVITQRDDLAGLELLLREAGEGETVHEALSGLDELGEEFEETLPFVLQFDDERLARAARLNLDAWWARFAARR